MEALEAVGYVVVPGVIAPERCVALARQFDACVGDAAGSRALLTQDWVRALAHELLAHPELAALLAGDDVVVQCTAFNKTVSRNWLVALHQDLSIPVAARVASARLLGWSDKEGGLYVQPPVAVLERMLALSLHLDDCDDANGALSVVPGSQVHGRLSADEAARLRAHSGERSVPVARGGVLALRPLLLHASSKAVEPRPRRVLHFVVGPQELPEGLAWPHGVVECVASHREHAAPA